MNKRGLFIAGLKYGLIAGTAFVLGGFLAGKAVILTLLRYAPDLPVHGGGWEGKYYNLIYATTPCPDVPLEKYEDENFSVFHYAFHDIPGVEDNPPGFSETNVNALERNLKYRQLPVIFAGRTLIGRHKPLVKPAGKEELERSAAQYAEERFGVIPEVQYGVIPGAKFSARFRSGSREMICFTGKNGVLYSFADPDMVMQKGDLPFGPNFWGSLGIEPVAIGDYAAMGVSGWLQRPRREKIAECNYFMVKRTLALKGAK